MFSFDAGAASVVRLNVPHSGYASVTVSGLAFGVGEQTATAGLERGGGGDLGVCFTSAWTSATTVACLSNAIGDLFKAATVTLALVSGTGKPIFSFDAAAASDVRLNTPPSGYVSLTVSGLNFGVADQTATAGLERGGGGDLGACFSSSWVSVTSLRCQANAFADMFRAVSVTVGAVSGTGRPIFSFDAAVVSDVALNAPHSGYASVTVSGLDFGVGEQTATFGLERGGGADRGACVTHMDVGHDFALSCERVWGRVRHS